MNFSFPVTSSNFLTFLNEDDQKFLETGSYSFTFGKFENDVIEYTIYDFQDNIIKWNVDYPKSNFSEINTIYKDYLGKTYGLNYKLYKGYYQTPRNEILVNPIYFLKSNGISEGSYKIKFHPIRDFLGSFVSKQKLKVISISENGKQLSCIPNTKYNSEDVNEINFNKKYNDFIQNKVYIKYISNDILKSIINPPLVEKYTKNKTENVEIHNEISFNYALVNDTAFYEFLYNTFNKISSYYQYYIFNNYDNVISFSDIKTEFQTKILEITNYELKRIRNKLTSDFESKYSQYLQFFYNIFSETISFQEIYDDYKKYYVGYFKYSLNFGNGNNYPFLSFSVDLRNGDHSIININFSESLESDVVVGQEAWINNLISLPYLKEFLIYKEKVVSLNRLKSPNFSIRNEIFGLSTKKFSYDKLTKNSDIKNKISNYLSNNSKIGKLNVDYRYFENFINFSTAESRLNNYDLKLNSINEIDVEIEKITIQANENYDSFYYSNLDSLNSKKQSILNDLDGYEKFLYENPEWYFNHSQEIGTGNNTYNSASLYDKTNDHSLVNNTPEHIVREPSNQEYVVFIQMVGQFFDDLWLYIKEFPSLKYPENNPSLGLSQDIIWNVLSSFGWELENGVNNQDLLLSILGQDENGNQIEKIPSQERTKIIWRRILSSLPYMLKTKGTEECIRTLLSCYGIPEGLFKIREYGGLDNYYGSINDSNYIFDEGNYSLKLNNGSENLETDWFSGSKTVEMKFSFDTSKTYNSGSQYQLILSDDVWAAGIFRDGGTYWGRGYFTISDGSGSLLSAITERIPVFNGDTFSLILRKNDQNTLFDSTLTSSSIDLIPLEYDIIIKNSEGDRINFEKQSTVILSGSYNTRFKETDKIYFGNYNLPLNSTNSFYGLVDQIKIWKKSIPDERLNSHVFFNNSYDSDDIYTNVENLVLHLNFSNPKNLYHSSSNSYIPNASYNKEYIEYVTASNFSNLDYTSSFLQGDCFCDTTTIYTSASFPWHFDEKVLRNYVSLPNFGSVKYKNNKIRIGEQTLVAPLSKDYRATERAITKYSNDSNLLGVYFSPIDVINDDILKFFGNINISDIIGAPTNVYDSQYKELKTFIKNYFKYGSLRFDNIFYINLVKAYFDKSIFKQIEKLVPAKTKLISGLLIEPHILERSKVQLRPIEKSIHNNFSVLFNLKNVLLSEQFPKLDDTISLGLDSRESSKFNDGKIYQNKNSSFENNYFNSIEDDYHLFSLFVNKDGVSRELDRDSQSFVLNYYKIELLNFKLSKVNKEVDSTYSLRSTNVNKINKIKSDSYSNAISENLSNTNSKLFKGLSKNHYKFRRKLFEKYSIQTSSTTIDPDSGIENDSLPISSTKVDRGSISTGIQNSGTILNIIN